MTYVVGLKTWGHGSIQHAVKMAQLRGEPRGTVLCGAEGIRLALVGGIPLSFAPTDLACPDCKQVWNNEAVCV